MKILSFSSAPELRAWLAKNHALSDGIRLRIYKKASGIATVSYAEALDQALCYGWIDGQRLPGDKQCWLQTFTPRRPKSGWSKRNTQHAERLIRSGEMAAAGLKEIDAAKADGRWQAAYDSFGTAAIPEDFLELLAGNKRPRRSSERSTRPTSIPSLTACRPPRSRKRATSACRPSSRSSRAAKNFIDWDSKRHPALS